MAGVLATGGCLSLSPQGGSSSVEMLNISGAATEGVQACTTGSFWRSISEASHNSVPAPPKTLSVLLLGSSGFFGDGISVIYEFSIFHYNKLYDLTYIVIVSILLLVFSVSRCLRRGLQQSQTTKTISDCEFQEGKHSEQYV